MAPSITKTNKAFETHKMRYFEPDDLSSMLTESGFVVGPITPLGGSGQVGADHWHMMAVAIKK